MRYLVLASLTVGLLLTGCESREKRIVEEVRDRATSENGAHRAIVVADGRREWVVVDGRAERKYDSIARGSLAFGERTDDCSYVAWRGDRQVLVVNGVEGPEFDLIRSSDRSFRSAAEFAYLAIRDGGWCVVASGRPVEPCGDVVPYSLTLMHGRSVVYVTRSGGRRWLSVDGRRYLFPHGSDTASLAVAAERCAFVAYRGDVAEVRLDGRVAGVYDRVGSIAFSADGRHVAWVARRGGRCFVVRDGRAEREYAEIGESGPRFSDDGLRLAYTARERERWHLIVDGERRDSARYICTPHFSGDGRHVAYVVRDRRGAALLRDGVVLARYEEIGGRTPRLSADGRHVAFVARRGGDHFVVYDGRELETCQAVRIVSFAPDGSSVTYAGQDAERQPIQRTVAASDLGVKLAALPGAP